MARFTSPPPAISDPVHVDEVYAGATRFGRRLAPGIVVAGLCTSILTSELVGTIGVSVEDRFWFTGPVFYGDTLTFDVWIAEQHDETRTIIWEASARNEGGLGSAESAREPEIPTSQTVMSEPMKKPDLRGVTVATVLPFSDNRSIDWDGYARVLDYCACPDGIAAVFVNGHAGEGGSLSDDERQAVIERTRRHIGKQAAAGRHHRALHRGSDPSGAARRGSRRGLRGIVSAGAARRRCIGHFARTGGLRAGGQFRHRHPGVDLPVSADVRLWLLAGDAGEDRDARRCHRHQGRQRHHLRL